MYAKNKKMVEGYPDAMRFCRTLANEVFQQVKRPKKRLVA
jgi:hypothetical protein